MITLHGLKGQITGQVFKDFLREDILLLGSNVNQTSGTQWQTLIKFRKSNVSLPLEFGYGLCLHSVSEKAPFVFELTESETRAKLKSWNYPAVEIEKLIKITPEVE